MLTGTEIALHRGDLPDDLVLADVVAIDSETTGLNLQRDRLCLVQLTDGSGVCHLVQFPPGSDPRQAVRLATLLADPGKTKLFHYARFDVAVLYRHTGILCRPICCTKIASKLVRTYTDRHGLKDLCRELLGVELSKEQQSSDWGAHTLTPEQMRYAASDVVHLHRLKARLDVMLAREGRTGLAEACWRFLPDRAALDIAGWADEDVFAH